MRAIGLLLRAGYRRHLWASLFIAVVAGLSAAVVGVSFLAMDRADSSLDRFTERARNFDVAVFGCPPEVDPNEIEPEQAQELCTSQEPVARLIDVLPGVAGVEDVAVGETDVVGLLDPTATNGWGRLTLMSATATPGPMVTGNPIILDGRMVDPAAPDEIVISEGAALDTGLEAGDEVQMASWHQEDLDAAVDGKVAPQTAPFTVTVVGVVRTLDDVQADGDGDISDVILSGDVYAGPGWVAVHGAEMAGYGSGVAARLRDGAAGADAFRAELDQGPQGWYMEAERITETSVPSIRRVIDLQQQAVLVFALIACLASIVFVGLLTFRQLRREAADAPVLVALGLTRNDRRLVNVLRGLSLAMPATLVAILAMFALAPIGPVGVARKLEFDPGLHPTLGLAVITGAAFLVFFGLVGATIPVRVTAASRRSHATRRRSRLDPAARRVGPVGVVAATLARGRAARAAIVVTAVALAAGVAAGGLVASYDKLLHEPERYGAWWDVAVGQYSSQEALDEGEATLRANPAVVAATGYDSQAEVAQIEGDTTQIIAVDDIFGDRHPAMVTGRFPEGEDEVALGVAVSERLGKGPGDEVTVTTSSGETLTLDVVGTLVVNEPINGQADAGEGALLLPAAMATIAGPGGISQSIVVALDPAADRDAAIESIRQDFPGSIREVLPQADVQNLGHVRAVPALIAVLIGLLAFATLVHALVTMVRPNRTMFGVLAAVGFTKGQRRSVVVNASVSLIVVGTAIGVPVGLVLGSRVWTWISDGLSIASVWVTPWVMVFALPIAAGCVAAFTATAAARGNLRVSPSEQLSTE